MMPVRLRSLYSWSLRLTTSFIVILLVGLSSSAGKSSISSPGLLFGLSPTNDESYAESYTLVARSQDDDYFLVQAMLMNGGIGDQKPACRILYVPRSGKGINEVNREGAWVTSKAEGRLKIGACILQETASGAQFKARTEHLKIELNLKGIKGHFSLKEMNFSPQTGESFVQSELIMPWAVLSGQISQSGKMTKHFRAHGTLNHTRSTALPPEVSKRYLKMYLFPKDTDTNDTSALLELRESQSGQLSAWAWSQEWPAPRAIEFSRLRLPRTWAKGLKTGDQVHLNSKQGIYQIIELKQVYSYEPIKAYGLAGRLLKKWVGDPQNITSFVELKSDKGNLKGFFEEITLR